MTSEKIARNHSINFLWMILLMAGSVFSFIGITNCTFRYDVLFYGVIGNHSSNAAKPLNNETLFSGEVKEFRIVADGFRNNQGMAIGIVYNRELYDLSEKNMWPKKEVPQIEKKVFDKLITNNKFLSDEDKSFLKSFYKLKRRHGIYVLTKTATKEETEKKLAIVQKMSHAVGYPIVDGKVQFTFRGLPKDQYYVIIFHDENGNYQLDERENLPPAEGIAVSGDENPLTHYPTFSSNNIVLDKDEMETTMHIYYY